MEPTWFNMYEKIAPQSVKNDSTAQKFILTKPARSEEEERKL